MPKALTLSASIRQENVFGSGHYLGFDINTGKFNRTLALNTVDPYWTVDGVSRAFDIYYRATSPLNTFGDSYQLVTWGAATRIGVPFTEVDTVFFGLGFESDADRRRRLPAQQLLPLSRGVRADQLFVSVHRGLVARRRATAPRCPPPVAFTVPTPT